jgi:hypothetical protein
MNDDKRDLALLQQEGASPSAEHDKAVLMAIDKASDRIMARTKPNARLRWISIPLALAASILLLPFWLGDRSDTLRESAGISAVTPPNAAELAAAPIEFRWTPQQGAPGYRVILRDSSGKQIADVTSEQTNNYFVLNDEMVRQIRPGDTYFWSVIVDDSSQQQLGPYWFSVTQQASFDAQ